MNKRILLVEDNQEISGDLVRISKRLGLRKDTPALEFELAEHVKDACLKLQQPGSYDALMLDIILPNDAEELKMVRELEAQRTRAEVELADILAGGESEDSAKAIRLQAEVMTRDEQIDRCQDIEGGLRIVESILVNGKVPSRLPIVFFTARSDPKLRKRFEPMLAPSRYEWIEKPETVEKVFAALRRLLDATRGGA